MTTTPILDPEAAVAERLMRKPRTLWSDARRRFVHNRLAMFGLVLVVFFIFLAIFADVLAPYRYDQAISARSCSFRS